MNEQRECSCGQMYWPNQKWIHKGCATNNDATNAIPLVERKAEEVRGPIGEVAEGQAGVTGKTRNRRSREAYNAYQREYMRKVRAK